MLMCYGHQESIRDTQLKNHKIAENNPEVDLPQHTVGFKSVVYVLLFKTVMRNYYSFKRILKTIKNVSVNRVAYITYPKGIGVLRSLDKEILGAMFDQFENGIILKDYVKSEKGVPGIFRIPKETTHEQLEQIVARFIEARGKLFNKGGFFRDFVDLKRVVGEVNEWRVFVFMGKIVAVEQNSNIDVHLNKIEKSSDEFIRMASHQLNLVSFFYTIDLAEKADGSWLVVETGDGQVSGLAPNQNPIGLYNSFIANLVM